MGRTQEGFITMPPATKRRKQSPAHDPSRPLGRGTSDGTDRSAWQSAARHKIDAANPQAKKLALRKQAYRQQVRALTRLGYFRRMPPSGVDYNR